MEKTTALFNRYLFTQIDLDSGALTSPGVIVHNFPKEGIYEGIVLRGKESIASFKLKVDEHSEQTQVDIDLAKLSSGPTEACSCHDADHIYTVSNKGYVVFHISGGPGGFTVLVGSADPHKSEVFFDSRNLQEGDLFAATLLRPGTYIVNNVLAKQTAKLIVAYPERRKTRYEQPPVQNVSLTAKGFEPNTIRVACAQSHVYNINVAARIQIKLETPDDGPSDKTQKYPSRTGPGMKQAQ